MIVVAEDAVAIEPLEVGSIQVNNGQRYDILVCQKPAPGKPLDLAPVWIRTVMVESEFPEPSAANTSLGVLYYSSKQPSSLPASKANFSDLLPELSPSLTGDGILNPYLLNTAGGITPPPADRTILFTIDFFNEPDHEPGHTE
jgi:hypothetical protein